MSGGKRSSFARRAAIGAIAAVVFLVGVWAGRIAWGTRADLQLDRIPVDQGRRAELGPAEDVSLLTSDGLHLRGWYAPSRNRAAVVFVPGLGSNRTQFLRPAAALVQRGYGVLVFDTRGQGESEGVRVSLGWEGQRDVDAAVSFLAHRPDVDSSRLAGVGFSVGGMALVLEAANDKRLAALVIAGSFPTLGEMIRLGEPGPRGWVSYLALTALGVHPGRVRPEDALCRISPRPLLLVFGTRDRARADAQRYRDHACGPARVAYLPDASHVDYGEAAAARFEAEIEQFLGESVNHQ